MPAPTGSSALEQELPADAGIPAGHDRRTGDRRTRTCAPPTTNCSRRNEELQSHQRGAGNLEGRAAVGQRRAGDGQHRTGNERRPAREDQRRSEQPAGDRPKWARSSSTTNLRIQRFTPAAVRFVNLCRTTWAGRWRTSCPTFIYPDLVQDARAVLETLAPPPAKCAPCDDRWCFVRIAALPHGGQRDRRRGDHHHRHHRAAAVPQDHAQMMRWAVEQAPSLVMITDADWPHRIREPAALPR